MPGHWCKVFPHKLSGDRTDDTNGRLPSFPGPHRGDHQGPVEIAIYSTSQSNLIYPFEGTNISYFPTLEKGGKDKQNKNNLGGNMLVPR